VKVCGNAWAFDYSFSSRFLGHSRGLSLYADRR